MFKKLFIVGIIFIWSKSFSQSANNSWDENYTWVDVYDLLKYEKQYSDSIRAYGTHDESYVRFAAFKFNATYTGTKRIVDEKSIKCIKNVLKHYGKDTSIVELMLNEYLFKIDTQLIWMPIQFQLEKYFGKEVKRKSILTLYCAFFNEYSFFTPLNNVFLVSEFIVNKRRSKKK